MLYLNVVGILIIDSLNQVTNGTGDQFNNLPKKKTNIFEMFV